MGDSSQEQHAKLQKALENRDYRAANVILSGNNSGLQNLVTEGERRRVRRGILEDSETGKPYIISIE